jgi:hypothetical protein
VRSSTSSRFVLTELMQQSALRPASPSNGAERRPRSPLR